MRNILSFVAPVLVLVACSGSTVDPIGGASSSGGSSGASSGTSGDVRCALAPTCGPGEATIGNWDTLDKNAKVPTCPAGATCKKAEACGYAVLCSQATCSPPSCAAGETVVSKGVLCSPPAPCPLAPDVACPSGLTCYDKQDCGQVVKCGKPACVGVATCDAGDKELAKFPLNCPGGCPPRAAPACPPNATCYSKDVCDERVFCAKSIVDCAALPVCNAGDEKVGPEQCAPPRASNRYEVTTCNMTICCQTKGI
jgi:hypothetical protein